MSSKPHPALKILKRYKNIVWPEINKYLIDPQYPRQFSIPAKYEHLKKFHWELISEYPKRQGKYLRPTLVMLASKAMGVKNKYSVKTAAAMQTSEEWILNHDDIEDGSPLRRGKPSLHSMYNPELAINSGDALHSIMWKMLIDNFHLLGNDKAIKIMDEFYKIIMRTTLGQTVDIKWFKENKSSLTDDDWYFIADSKSSYYTITAPIRLGGILANANNKQLDLLADFGLQLGRSFQLIDDILDITSNFSGLKQRGNDVYEGKRTIILGHLLGKASAKDKKRVLEILKKPRNKKTPREIDWIISKMKSYGSIDYAKDLAINFKEKAHYIFDTKLTFLSQQPARGDIVQIMDFILERDH